MGVSEQQLIDALRPVTDPELHVSIVDLRMVKGVSARRGHVSATIALTVAGCPMRDEVTRRVRTALTAVKGVKDVDVDLAVMTPQELEAVRSHVAAARSAQPEAWAAQGGQAASPQGQGGASGGDAHAGHSHGPQQRRPLGHEE